MMNFNNYRGELIDVSSNLCPLEGTALLCTKSSSVFLWFQPIYRLVHPENHFYLLLKKYGYKESQKHSMKFENKITDRRAFRELYG